MFSDSDFDGFLCLAARSSRSPVWKPESFGAGSELVLGGVCHGSCSGTDQSQEEL